MTGLPRNDAFLRARSLRVASLCMMAVFHGVLCQAFAANRTWEGNESIDFETPANWTALPVDSLTSDIGVFSGTPTGNQPQLTASRGINGLLFSTPTGGWTLGSGSPANVLTLGGNGISTAGQTSGTNTLGANLAIGAAQTWAAGTGGNLLFTGSITGTGGFPLTVNNGSNLGSVILSPAAGNNVSLTGSSNTSFSLLARSGGLLVLGGDGVNAPVTESVNTIVNNSTGSTFGAMTITGSGAVQVNSGTWNMGDLARNGSADFFSGSLEVKGGSIVFNGARYLAAGNVTVSGGALKVANTGSIYSNGGRFSLGAVGSSGTATMTVTGGQVELAQANGGNTIGTAISTWVNQSGGTFSNGVTPGGGTNGGTATTLTIGHSGMTSAGSGATLTYTAVSNILTSYTLSGGTLLSAGAIQGTTPAAPGTDGSSGNPPGAVVSPGTGNVRNFNFNGGVLAVGAFNATHLGYSSSTGLPGGGPHADPTANSTGIGTLHQNGGTLAPGGIGTAGKTAITGGYAMIAGTFAVDLGGSFQATAFQTGQSDFLTVSGTATLGGNLAVSLIGSHVPQAGDSHTVLTAGNLTGAFSNVAFGSRVATSDGAGSYRVSKVGNSVTLDDYQPLTAPVITSQPVSQSMSVGASATFAVVVTSSVQPVYQWRKDGIPMNGETAPSLVISWASMADAGSYDVVVTTPAGSVTSSAATLTVQLFGPEVTGERSITYDNSGVRGVSPPPAHGIHPRVYFNAEDLPAIRSRLANTAVGLESMKMIRLYTDFLRNGRSIAWDSKPASFKLMPDGSNRIGNAGLYDRSLVYNQLIAGNTTKLAEMIAANDGTGLYTLAGEMSLEAFECLVDEGQPGIATRAQNLAAALDTWAVYVLALPDFPDTGGAWNSASFNNQHQIGGHLSALTYDMVFNAMSPTQRTNVRNVLAKLMSAYRATEYTGVGCAPEAVATNWVAINSFKLITACALEGEIVSAEHGFSSADLDAWFSRAMGAHHKFMTYGWFASGAGLEGQGKNYLFGAHMIPYARRGYDFFSHPHTRAYGRSWMPAVTQPFGYSFTAYDLLGGSGPDPEKGRLFLNSLDYIGMKWMYPDDDAVDFTWRNFVLTEYEDSGGNPQTFLDLREAKFTLRSVYQNQLLPAAIFASDISSTSTWQAQNATARASLDFLDAEGGTVVSRSGHDADATSLLFHVRQDFGGHTCADRNTFTLSALGRLFVNYNSGSTNSGLQEAKFHSIVEVDGLSMATTPKEGVKCRIPAKLAAWSPGGGDATFATGDATYAYSNDWDWIAYTTTPSLRGGFTFDNNNHNTFRRSGNKISEAFGNTPFVGFPHWVNPGQFEGIQSRPFNPMRQVYRTIGLVRGEKPYVLVIDDVRKDDATHTYKWFASIAEDLTIVTGASLPAGADPLTDVVLEEPAATGNRRLLVRILNANGTPVSGTAPSVQGTSLAYTETINSPNTTETWKRLVVERASVIAPDFRILLFPFRSGDALPVTGFSGNSLSVTLGSQSDAFTFAPRSATVGGQTVTMNEFTLSRGGSMLLDYRNQIEPTAVRGPAGIPDTPPAAPGGLSGTLRSGPQVLLEWTDAAAGETAYVVERSPSGQENWTPLATTLPADTTSYQDGTVELANSYDYRVRASGMAGLSSYATVTVAIPAAAPSALEDWRSLKFGSSENSGCGADSADPDADGLVNLIEYALGSEPLVFSPEAMPAMSVHNAHLQLAFNRIADPTLGYHVEASGTLAPDSWTSIWQSDGEANLAGPVIAVDPEVISNGQPPRRFLRLRVTSP